MDDTSLPLNEYCGNIIRSNGDDYSFILHKKKTALPGEIDDMARLSEIFNDVSDTWKVEHCDEKEKTGYNLRIVIT